MARKKQGATEGYSEKIAFLKRLTSAFGPSSFEDDVRALFREEVKGYADRVTTCGLGSVIAAKKGTADSPKIMVAGHMD